MRKTKPITSDKPSAAKARERYRAMVEADEKMWMSLSMMERQALDRAVAAYLQYPGNDTSTAMAYAILAYRKHLA